MTVDNSLPQRRMDAAKAARSEANSSSTSGGGPRDPTLERRVDVIETELKEISASVRNTELAVVRIEATLATKTDVAALTERLAAHTTRLAALEDSNKSIILSALSKTVGIGGAIALFVSLATIGGLAIALLRYFHLP